MSTAGVAAMPMAKAVDDRNRRELPTMVWRCARAATGLQDLETVANGRLLIARISRGKPMARAAMKESECSLWLVMVWSPQSEIQTCDPTVRGSWGQ